MLPHSMRPERLTPVSLAVNLYSGSSPTEITMGFAPEPTSQGPGLRPASAPDGAVACRIAGLFGAL